MAAKDLVLLHGLGATRAVWDGFARFARPQHVRVHAFDLPGHGRQPPPADYAVTSQAQTLGRQIAAQLGEGAHPIILGHSLGGVLALALASGRYGVAPAKALGLSIKAAWTEVE